MKLIQSSIRFPGQEQGTEELELSLYGGDKVGDYVTLIQSSIRFPEQGTEELELSLYGGDKVGDDDRFLHMCEVQIVKSLLRVS